MKQLTPEQASDRISLAAELFASQASELLDPRQTGSETTTLLQSAMTSSINLARDFHDKAEAAFSSEEPSQPEQEEEIKPPAGAPPVKAKRK